MKDERTKLRRWLFCGILFGMFCVAYGYFYLVSTMEDPEVADECRAIAALVESAPSIPESVSVPGRPGFFCEKGVRGVFLRSYCRVHIYGVTDPSQQDLVVGTLRRARHQLKTRSMVVNFYETENWKTWEDAATGRSGGTRGPEMPIRRIVID